MSEAALKASRTPALMTLTASRKGIQNKTNNQKYKSGSNKTWSRLTDRQTDILTDTLTDSLIG